MLSGHPAHATPCLTVCCASADGVAESMQLRYCLCWVLRPLCAELGAAAPTVLQPGLRARLFDALGNYSSAGERADNSIEACMHAAAPTNCSRACTHSSVGLQTVSACFEHKELALGSSTAIPAALPHVLSSMRHLAG